MGGFSALFTEAQGPRAAGLGACSKEPLNHHARDPACRSGGAGRGGAEQRATLSALGEVRTRAASLAPAPAGSMTPRWLLVRGGVG